MKLLLFNIAGAALFLLVAVPLWAEPEVAHIPGAGAGSPIVWVLAALPVVLLAMAVNLAFLARTAIARARRRSTLFVRWHLAIPALWALVLYLDISHHWLL